MKLSHSSISMYAECPRKWKLKYIDKIPERPKHYFSFGKAIHTALEAMYSVAEAPRIDAVLAAFDRAWSSTGYKDERTEVKAREDGEAMLRAYYEANSPSWRSALATEFRFDLWIDGIEVVGVIDRIDAMPDCRLALTDYKTGRELDAGKIETDEQLTMYQLAVEEDFMGQPERVGGLALCHVPTGSWHRTGRRADGLVATLRAKIKATAAAINAGVFSETPSEKACSRCDYKVWCSMWGR